MEARLKTRLMVQAAVRLCGIQAIPVVVARRGDDDSGAILLKLDRRQHGFQVLAQARGPKGELAWLKATGETPVDEATADAYISRQIDRDPDIWVVEIEDPDARPVFGGTVL